MRHHGRAGDGDADPDHRQQLRGVLQRVQEAREADEAEGGAREGQGGGEGKTGKKAFGSRNYQIRLMDHRIMVQFG